MFKKSVHLIMWMDAIVYEDWFNKGINLITIYVFVCACVCVGGGVDRGGA